jgi:hypothetical protein
MRGTRNDSRYMSSEYWAIISAAVWAVDSVRARGHGVFDLRSNPLSYLSGFDFSRSLRSQAAGMNFGSVTPSPVSSNTTCTGMSMCTLSMEQPMMLLQKRGPSSRSTQAVT